MQAGLPAQIAPIRITGAHAQAVKESSVFLKAHQEKKPARAGSRLSARPDPAWPDPPPLKPDPRPARPTNIETGSSLCSALSAASACHRGRVQDQPGPVRRHRSVGWGPGRRRWQEGGGEGGREGGSGEGGSVSGSGEGDGLCWRVSETPKHAGPASLS